MTNIKAFKGIVYNLEKIVDASLTACPPYDVISKEEQDFYYRQSPYNFIRLILNKDELQDNASDNKYTRAVKFFNEWLKIDILKQDRQKAIYFYKQDFFCGEKEFSRLGFIALLEISDDDIVFPHENTHAAPKTDRLELIKNIKANLSPIFTIFSDKNKIIDKIYKTDLVKRKPDLLLKDVQGIRNSIWRISDEKMIKEICNKMKDRQIFIADGHHRYEVAATYLKLMKEKDRNYSLEKSYNYIMTYFTALESSGLCIMPVHRIIKSKTNIDRLKIIFDFKRAASTSELEDKLDSFSKKECVFGLYHNNDFFLLKLKDKKQVNSYFVKTKCFINLDVAILDFYALTELLKIKKDDIIYSKDIIEAKELVDKKSGSLAFILRPTNIKQIRDVALCKERMPPKSTYFYPKLLSGLVVHKFNEDIS